MKKVIAMHGWCSDSQYWSIWEEAFKAKGWYWDNADRGYANEKNAHPIWTENTTSNTQNKKVLICHSLGIFLIGKEIISQASHIVLINSFSRFIPISKESRALRIGLKGMQKKLNTMQEKKMFYLFWEKASFPYNLKKVNPGLLNTIISNQGRQKLRTDLDLLINTQKLPEAINKTTKVLVIDGEKDRIVVSKAKNDLINELSERLGKYPEHWLIHNEGHVILLPHIIQKTRLWLESN